MEPPDEHLPSQTVFQTLAQLQAFSNRVTMLNRLVVDINRAHDLTSVLGVVSQQVGDLLDFEHCSVYLCPDDNWHLITLSGQPPENPLVDDDDTIAAVLAIRAPVVILDSSIQGTLSRYASLIALPLESEGELLGTLQFASAVAHGYGSDDVRIASLLAQQLATAIHNAERFEALQAAQAALTVYAAELEARNRELDAYSHTIAHDLKAPLNLIFGYAHMLDFKDELDADARSYLGQIQVSAHSMTRMIDRLLFLARVRDDTALETVSVFPVVLQAAERFSTSIAEKGIQLEIMEDLPDACGHDLWIEEVFANLIGNAVKYIGRNNAAPRIAIKGSQQDGMARYEVCDNGIGIAPENQMRLFEMFARLNDDEEGVGLGLSIVRRIVQRLGGKVGLESEPGAGSTFWFTLPAQCE